MTTYSIELCYESGEKKYVPLAAKSDSQATKLMRDYLKTSSRQLMDVNAFLAFDRDSDGQHGYINQDGASPTGKTWN
jgi:hypothetical protein